MADEIAPGAWFQLVDDAMERISRFNTKFMTSTKLCSIDEEGVLVENIKTGEKLKLKADAVVLAMGVKSDRLLSHQIESYGFRTYRVGDADKSGTIAHACHSAYDTAMKIGKWGW